MNKRNFTCLSIGALIGNMVFNPGKLDTTILLIIFWGFWYVMDYLQDILKEFQKNNERVNKDE